MANPADHAFLSASVCLKTAGFFVSRGNYPLDNRCTVCIIGARKETHMNANDAIMRYATNPYLRLLAQACDLLEQAGKKKEAGNIIIEALEIDSEKEAIIL